MSMEKESTVVLGKNFSDVKVRQPKNKVYSYHGMLIHMQMHKENEKNEVYSIVPNLKPTVI